jgi:plasmid stabilization system protein ParE
LYGRAHAEQDLLSIWRYGADKWSSTAADYHLRKISRACARLLESPELGKARDELIHGLPIPVDPHIVFYRISMTAAEIVRVLHQREDIEIIFH